MIKNMYEQAKKHWESIKPLRGRAVDTRPFASRRRTNEIIRLKYNSDGTEDVEFVLYETPVLTVHPDNTFSLMHGGWITPSTAAFLGFCFKYMGWTRQTSWNGVTTIATAGVAFFYKEKNQLWWTQQTVDKLDLTRKVFKEISKTYPIGKEPTRYKWDDKANAYMPTAPVHIKVKAVRTDKAKSKQVLEKLKPFRKYVATVTKLNDGGPLVEETLDKYARLSFSECLYYMNFYQTESKLDEIKAYMEGDDPEDWLVIIASASVNNNWRIADLRMYRGSPDPTKRVKARLDRAIKKLYQTEQEVILEKSVGADT